MSAASIAQITENVIDQTALIASETAATYDGFVSVPRATSTRFAKIYVDQYCLC